MTQGIAFVVDYENVGPTSLGVNYTVIGNGSPGSLKNGIPTVSIDPLGMSDDQINKAIAVGVATD